MIGFKKVPTKLVIGIFFLLIALVLLLYLDLTSEQPPAEEEIAYSEAIEGAPLEVVSQQTYAHRAARDVRNSDQPPLAAPSALAALKRLSRAQAPKTRGQAPTVDPRSAQPAAPRPGLWLIGDRQRAADGQNPPGPPGANRPNAHGSKILFPEQNFSPAPSDKTKAD